MEYQIYADSMVSDLTKIFKILKDVNDTYRKVQKVRDDTPQTDDLKEELLDHQIDEISDVAAIVFSLRNIISVGANKLIVAFELSEERYLDVVSMDIDDDLLNEINDKQG